MIKSWFIYNLKLLRLLFIIQNKYIKPIKYISHNPEIDIAQEQWRNNEEKLISKRFVNIRYSSILKHSHVNR